MCSTTAVAGEDRRRINNRGRGKKKEKNTHIVISILRFYYLFGFSKHLAKKKVKSDRKISLFNFCFLRIKKIVSAFIFIVVSKANEKYSP